MELSFEGASVDAGKQYIEPGVHIVKIKEVKSGLSSQKQSPYVEFVVEDNTKATCSHQYYLNTEPGLSGKSAWDISKNAILQLIMAGTNTDEATAKSKMPMVKSGEELAMKLSTLLVGKTIGLHLAGKWVNPTDTSKNPWIKAEFAGYKFAVPADRVGELKHDSTKHIKGAPATNVPSTGAVVASDKW